MGRAAALREAALDKFQQADKLAQHPNFNQEIDGPKFEALFAQGKALMGQFEAVGGKTVVVDDDGLVPGIPFSGRGGGSAGELRPGRSSIHTESWGQQIVDALGGQTKMLATGLLTNGTVPVSVPLRTPIVTEAQRVSFLRQLIPTIPSPTGRYSYLQQTVRTNNAAAVAEGAVKPTSVYTAERIDDRVRTIAHLSEPIPRQQIADAPLLQQFVDGELRYGLDLEVDDQILNGNGIGENMTGILDPTIGIQSQAFATSLLITTRKAVTKLEVVDLQPTGYVINPNDWETLELETIDTLAANPNVTAPTNSLTRRLWGVPVVVSNGVPEGTALLGDFRNAELYVTEEARIDWSEAVFDPTFGDAGASDFQRNLLRFRAECRMNIAILRPLAFVEIDMSAVS